MTISTAESLHTPTCAEGFVSRLEALLLAGGISERHHVSFVAKATKLSNSGVRRIFSDKRPPKQLASFMTLCEALAVLLTEQTQQSVTASNVFDYLVYETEISHLAGTSKYDLSQFLGQHALVTSKVIITVDTQVKQLSETAKKNVSEAIKKRIYFQITAYCVKNSIDPDSTKVKGKISSFLELASENLL